jgi:shikimate dehydrogenase
MLNGKTLLYPILGDPIVFVRSPRQLTARFVELGHNGMCLPMQLKGGDGLTG